LLAQAAYQALGVLRERGLTVLIAEQQVPLAMAFSDRGYVLENGFIGLEGTTEELAANPGIRRAYLGVTA
jgi:branched-chain amino acid transport system ATP-binding protein